MAVAARVAPVPRRHWVKPSQWFLKKQIPFGHSRPPPRLGLLPWSAGTRLWSARKSRGPNAEKRCWGLAWALTIRVPSRGIIANHHPSERCAEAAAVQNAGVRMAGLRQRGSVWTAAASAPLSHGRGVSGWFAGPRARSSGSKRAAVQTAYALASTSEYRRVLSTPRLLGSKTPALT
jgi:hypothetical protein